MSDQPIPEENPMYGRRATDSLPPQMPHAPYSGKKLSDWISQILVGCVSLILVGLGWLINDFGKKVEKLADKVGMLTETVILVGAKQTNTDEKVKAIESTVNKHIDDDNTRYRAMKQARVER